MEIYKLDSAYFLSAPGSAWKPYLKKMEIELKLLTDIDMLVMVEKAIRGEMCHAIHCYTKANKNYMKDYEPSKESSYLMYWDVKNLYAWMASLNLPVGVFKRRKNLFRFIEEFIQTYDENSDKGYILEVDIDYPKELQKACSGLPLPFLPKKWRLISVRNLCVICMTRKTHARQEKCHTYKSTEAVTRSWANIRQSAPK